VDDRRQRPEEVTDFAGRFARIVVVLRRRKATVVATCGVVFFLAFAAGACRQSANPASSDRTRVRIAVPESTASGADIGINQFVNLMSLEGLIYVGADGRPIPWLAKGWAWENNNRRLRVYLRSNAYLHDGRPLNAALAVQMLNDATARSKALYPALNDVIGIRALDDHELVLDLSQPSGQLPEDLGAPLRIQAKDGTVIGTGPYRVSSRSDRELLLEGFDRYYLGKPTIDQVQVRPVDTLRTSWASLLRGEVDVVSDVPADATEFIRNDDVQIVSFARWYQYLIAFNSHRGPLRSTLVRRALNLAIDRDAVIKKVLRGTGTPSLGPVWPQYWAYDTGVPTYRFDKSQAAALLDAAGYPLPKAPPRDSAPARLRFTCLVPQNFTVLERLALEVQKYLFDINVDMQFRAVSVAEFNRRFMTGDFDAAINDVISGPTPGRAAIFWRSAQTPDSFNKFGYRNSDADQLFDLLRHSTNEATTRSATRRLQETFRDDPPALFLAWNTRARAIRRDFSIPEAGRDPIQTLWKWAPSATATRLAKAQ
jgi:peptide/nickel transport system substrate-binding protein